MGTIDLELLHYLDHELSSGFGELALVDQNLYQFFKRHIMHVNQDEAILEGFRKFLTTSIALSRILSGENAEIGMCLDDFLGLNYQKFPVVIQ